MTLDQGTLNFAQAVQSWDGQGTATFSTTQVWDRTRVLCNQNFLKACEAGRASTDTLPNIRAEVTRVETELEDRKADSIQQQTEIARLTRSLDLVLAAVSMGSSSSSWSQDITAPNKFSGDRKAYRTFKAQLHTKLAGDTLKFRDDQHKMIYITYLLEGNAHGMIYPYIVDDRLHFNTIKELWDILAWAYDDSDRRGTAERELALVKQGTREFSAYFADFQSIMAELQWNPSATKAALLQRMAGNLKEILLSYDCPNDWSVYIRLLPRLDSKLCQREVEMKKKTTDTSRRAIPSSSSPAAPSSTTHITSNPTYLDSAPMDLSAAQKQAEPERIYQERQRGGLCTYCVMAGHFRAACPRCKRHPLTVAEATLTSTPLCIEATPTAGKDQSHPTWLAPPWDVLHLSNLSFVVVRRKDR